MSRIIQNAIPAPFVGRNGFGPFLIDRGLDGYGAEVGTHRGGFAHALLSSSRLRRLYCVDPYEADYDPTDPAARGDRGADKRAAREILSPHGQRFVPVYSPSVVAARSFRNGELDFVYVDASHQPEAVRADLEAWWPKVKQGGILAGHDIVCPGEPNGGWGQYIQPAVFGMAEREGVDVCLVSESNGTPWSYYLVKEAKR